MKFIKNPPTRNDIIHLFECELYQELVDRFLERTGEKLAEDQSSDRFLLTSYILRNFLILNIPFSEVEMKFREYSDILIKYCINHWDYFNRDLDQNSNEEFSEGEELEDDEKSILVEELGISRPFLLIAFCELYLLKLGDKERLYHYLKTIKYPRAKIYQSEILEVFEKINN